jgi:GMP synthase (glutamine-hydrolysing)
LDLDGLRTRIEVYKHAGYFEPQTAQSLVERLCRSTVRHPAALVRTFVESYVC